MAYLADNPNYWCSVYQQSSGLQCLANVPEQFGVQLLNEWESLIGVLTGNLAGGGRLSNFLTSLTQGLYAGASAIGGFRLQPRIFSRQVWMGTTPLEFSVPLVFDAHDSVEQDVVTPVRNLIAIASPGTVDPNGTFGTILGSIATLFRLDRNSLNDQFLTAPGPTITDPTTNAITLQIGRSMFFRSVVITSVQIDQEAFYDVNGLPKTVTMNVGFRTHQTLSRDDILSSIFPTLPPNPPIVRR